MIGSHLRIPYTSPVLRERPRKESMEFSKTFVSLPMDLRIQELEKGLQNYFNKIFCFNGNEIIFCSISFKWNEVSSKRQKNNLENNFEVFRKKNFKFFLSSVIILRFVISLPSFFHSLFFSIFPLAFLSLFSFFSLLSFQSLLFIFLSLFFFYFFSFLFSSFIFLFSPF